MWRKHFWSFGCLCCFIHSSLSPESDFVWTSSSFVWRKRFCQCWVFVCLFVFRLGYFIYFLCFEPPSDFVWTSSSFVLEKAFWSIFGVCVVSFYFLRFSPPKAISWDFSFFCVGGSFLVDVGYSICVVSFYFLRFCHLHPDFACWSSPRVGVGVGPNSLNLRLGLGFNPNPNPGLRGWGGVSPDSGTRGWGWG